MIDKFVIINLENLDYFKDKDKKIHFFNDIDDARRTAWMYELENVHILKVYDYYDEEENENLHNKKEGI